VKIDPLAALLHLCRVCCIIEAYKIAWKSNEPDVGTTLKGIGAMNDARK
jgi:hypothetical protein